MLGLAGAALLVVVSALLTALAPSESWDGFFYHEPIVGFALQNQGFRMVSLPPSVVVQGVNGYPRLCAAFALWFVVFTDKTLTRGRDEGAVATTLILTIVPMIWTGWFFGTDFKGISTLLRSTARERAILNVADFQMPRETARAREGELGPGELVVFTQETAFPGVLRNHRMSNRVEYLELAGAPLFLAEIEGRHPKCMVVGAKSPAHAVLAAQPAAWQYVGVACKQDQTVAFRRR